MSCHATAACAILLCSLSGVALAQSAPHGPEPAQVSASFTPASSCAEFIADATSNGAVG